MNRTCGEPSWYELTHSPEFADRSEPEPDADDIETELESRIGLENHHD